MSTAARLATKVKRVVRKLASAAPHEIKAAARELPIDHDVVLYESFAGNGMLCNPEAIFRALLDDEDNQHLRHVWVLADPDAADPAVSELRNHPRVRFVKRGSTAYHRALATAGLLINNATFPPHWGKRPGQVYLNTWHGTPLKTMGYDEPGGAFTARNVLRNFLMADYLLSTSPFMSEQMYERAYRLTNVGGARLLELGQPRTDAQFAGPETAAAVREQLCANGARISPDETLVLLAPTWKGASFHAPDNDAALLADRIGELEALLDPGHRVLLKVHQQVYAYAVGEPRLAGRLVPNHVPTNTVLSATDVLVTDYSSIFFDFLSSGRPIVFFTPDKEEYDSQRGAYLEASELPGPQVTTVRQLAELLGAVGTGSELDPVLSHGHLRDSARRRFAPRDDGGATQRVLDVVLRGDTTDEGVRPPARDGRSTLLLYLGGMMSNGITSAGLNLLRSIDHERWDVTAVVQETTNADRVVNIEMIDPRVRQLHRKGGMVMSKRLRASRRKLMRGRVDELSPVAQAKLEGHLSQELRRVVGDAVFDHVVDFSGYSPAWTFLLGHASGKRAVWQHNDLLADQMRQVHGRRPHERNLAGVFSSYRLFDRLVSVSEALRDINAANLGQYAPAERFVAARNTLDVQRVISGAADAPPPGTIDGLAAPGDQEPYVFVTVGRLSPEKNQARLIEAFARVHEARPHARLLLIGDGPLRARLEASVTAKGLGHAVRLVGLQRNPWSIMAASSCFVLSSDYEGQPMVILEARTLGLPVVSTAFDSVGSALEPGDGLVVGRSVAALAEGMIQAVDGHVAISDFDPVAYNEDVVAEFERAIGASCAPASTARRP